MDNKTFFQKVSKSYKHIDSPLSKQESVKYLKSLDNIDNIKGHRFLPLIQFDITFKKHPKPGKTVNIKKRGISLVSHHDAGIYAVLAEELNKAYNRYSTSKCISDSSVAYRSDLEKGKKISNITVAKEVFDFIDRNHDVWIIKGDFEGFFDNLNHDILNKNAKKVLNLSASPEKMETWFKVLRSLEKYVYIEKVKLLEQMNSMNYKYDKKNAYFRSLKDFGSFIKENKFLLHKNKRKGIPQGTSISAILANVYMVDFDRYVCDQMDKFSGIYRRYSDDFIIVIPKSKITKLEFSELEKEIHRICINKTKLKIEKEKTKILSIESGVVTDWYKQEEYFLDYLGFIYQNNSVSFRGKSIYKFYYRGRKALEAASTAKSTYDILTNKFDYDYQINDETAQEVLSLLTQRKMHKCEKRANLNRIKRVMYHHKAATGLPELKKYTQKYLMKIENTSPRFSFLSYAKIVNDIFNQGEHSYKVMFLHQANKVRKRLLKYKWS